VKDRFGEAPFALIHNLGGALAFTFEGYKLAIEIAKICRCRKCDCCAVVAYVKENAQ